MGIVAERRGTTASRVPDVRGRSGWQTERNRSYDGAVIVYRVSTSEEAAAALKHIHSRLASVEDPINGTAETGTSVATTTSSTIVQRVNTSGAGSVAK